MNLRKSLCVSLFFVLSFLGFINNVLSQERSRFAPEGRITRAESQPINSPQKNYTEIPQRQIPPLTNKIVIQNSPSLVKKTVSSQPVNAAAAANYVSKVSYSAGFNQKLFLAIQDRMGIPYRYGSSGPTTYDCSGLVWSVFEEAGFDFERTSARTIWQNSAPVDGDDKYKFGTLVFFNGLGHIGIVADAEGFYHASLSHGVTYSKFDGYWAKRIVGFRRLQTMK